MKITFGMMVYILTTVKHAIAVQDQAILHEELKCLRAILKMSLFHCSYFIKQLPNGFPSRIA
jgi:hypothetical protein